MLGTHTPPGSNGVRFVGGVLGLCRVSMVCVEVYRLMMAKLVMMCACHCVNVSTCVCWPVYTSGCDSMVHVCFMCSLC